MSRTNELKNEDENVFITSFSHPYRKSTAKKVLPILPTEEDLVMTDLMEKCNDLLSKCR